MRTSLLAVAAVVALSVSGCASSEKDDGGDQTAGAIAANAPAPRCKSKKGLKDCSSQATRAKAISRETFALKELLQAGMHDFARGKKAQSSDPMELVKMWLLHSNGGDKDEVKKFKLKTKFDKLPADEEVAGIYAGVAQNALDDATQAINDDRPDDSSIGKKAFEHLKTLKDLGVVFGTDGFQQNGCAAPTFFLLVIDTAGKTVDGIDLTPCEE